MVTAGTADKSWRFSTRSGLKSGKAPKTIRDAGVDFPPDDDESTTKSSVDGGGAGAGIPRRPTPRNGDLTEASARGGRGGMRRGTPEGGGPGRGLSCRRVGLQRAGAQRFRYDASNAAGGVGDPLADAGIASNDDDPGDSLWRYSLQPADADGGDPPRGPAGPVGPDGRRRRSSVFVRNRVKEEQTARRLQEMQLRVKRYSIGDIPGDILEGPEGEDAEPASSAGEADGRRERTIRELEQKLSETERHNESTTEEAEKWKRRHYRMKRLNKGLTQVVESKAVERLQSAHSVDPPEEAEEAVDWRGRYDVLVGAVGDLAKENSRLVVQCRQLEENEKNHKEELDGMEGMREENDALHESMEEAMRLPVETSEEMANFVGAHRRAVGEYEEKLAIRNDQLDKAALSIGEVSEELDALKDENEVLRHEFEECGEKYHDKLAELDAAKTLSEENMRLRAELEEARMAEDFYEEELAELAAKRDDAYSTCEVLQREIDELHKTMEYLRGDEQSGEGK